jgi:lysozyme family protein
MRDIPYDLVLRIYRTAYWNFMRGNLISNQEIAEELFDTGVNIGMRKAIEFLQRTLNVLNKKGTLYQDVAVDGVLGDHTLATLNRVLLLQLPWFGLCILRALDSLQCVHYIELAEKNPKFESFMAGWLRTRVGVED